MSMLVTIAIGVSVTFGATELLIGQLNMATGFLFTIVAGNGINAGIIYMARYLELRRLGASNARVLKDVTLPLIRFGLLASWLLVFMIFEREYSTGVYLLGQGTEVIGSMLVSLWGAGAIDQVAALSLINIALVAVGLAVALRFGVRLHE